MTVVTGSKKYFKSINQIKYEGPGSDNPLAFRWYDENKVVAGKTMKEHLRFASAYWHSFTGSGADPFGEPTHLFPWTDIDDPVERSYAKADVAFEFISKLGVPYYCFHDVDVVDYNNDIKENEKRLQAITDYLKQKQNETGIKLLWGTANLFSNKRYMNGAATNPDFHVLAHAGAQVKAALDATIELGGENYVFWGGREGYMSLLNTNIEVNHATLAGHTFTHELQASADAGVLGSIDANRGDYQNGWDTDQFPNDVNELTEAMLVILQAGGFKGGGINFDAKIRRNSTDNDDLFHAHIGGIDTFARALLTADNILNKSDFKKFRKERYATFDSGTGKEFEEGKLSLEDLRTYAIENGEPAMTSGKQEYFENIINRF